MFITPLSYGQTFDSKYPAPNKISFKKGLSPEVVKNQYKILLTQDIWADKLKVRIPETSAEKEALIEVLQNRLKLDRFARLNNEFFKLKTNVSFINSLLEKDPSNTTLPELIKEIENHGNLQSVYKTMEKQIQLEANKNKPALDYFKNIEQLEEEYLKRHLVKPSKMEKFWYQIEKNNINTDGKYSTKDLLDIISKGNAGTTVKTAPLTKKQLLDKVTQQYEDLLRERINIYGETIDHTPDAVESMRILAKENLADIQRFPDIAKQIGKICKSIEAKIKYKADRLAGIYIHPIGEIWHDMAIFKSDIKLLTQDIAKLKEQIVKNPDNELLKMDLAIKEDLLEKTKSNWLSGLKYSIKYEAENRQKMAIGGRSAEYDYLTCKNPILANYKKSLELVNRYDNKIPDEVWEEILK